MTYQPPPICFYLNSEETRYHRVIHCIECGLPFIEMTGEVRAVIDNNGIDQKEIRERGFTLGFEVWCKRCKTPYKFYF